MASKAACLALLALAALCAVAPGAEAAGDFVTVNSAGSGFSTATCPNFVFSGYNTWQPIEAAAGILGPSNNVETQFDAALQNNLNVIRMFGFSVQQGINNQYSPGVYNESMLVGFDKTIAAADKRNIKLIIALANNWDYNGNMSDNKYWYTNFSTTGARSGDDFFTDQSSIDNYLLNARNIMGRRNTITNKPYNQDPTIMAWDLINEGRCEATCTAADIQAWTARVAPIVKSYAPQQLITIGQDGFWQADNCASNTVNPVPNEEGGSPGWPLKTGQDFLTNHAVDGVDFTSIHLWPDRWARTDLDFGKAWINAHLSQARLLKKPLILEEFGKSVGGTLPTGQKPADQEGYYRLAYAIAEGSINSGDALRGIAFWRWDNVDPSAQLVGKDQEATITTPGAVFQQIVKPFSGRVAAQCPSNSGTGGTAAAGRRLLQVGVPGTQVTGTTAPVSPASPAAATAPAAATPARTPAATATTPAPAVPASPTSNVNAQVSGALCQANLTVPGQSSGR